MATGGWLWWIAWAIWAAGPALALGLTMRQRNEYEADQRRLEGGTIYTDIVWEIKGEAERSLRRLLGLMIASKDKGQQETLAEEIQAQQRNMERVNRLLHFKRRG